MQRRIDLIKRHLDPASAAILEIGALDSPTFTRDRYQVKYVDYASREDLARDRGNNPRYAYERLVDVDYVVLGQRYCEVVDRKFDVIVANHVIEHIPDAIGWLQDLGKLLQPRGIVFLSVPDRRFTFDIARRESNYIDLLRPHLAGQTKPDFLNLLDHFWNHKSVKPADVLQGRHHDLIKKMRFTPEAAFSNALRLSRQPYADVHCHVFTEDSFKEAFALIRGFGYLAYTSMTVYPLREGNNEFNVVLGGFDESLFRQAMVESE